MPSVALRSALWAAAVKGFGDVEGLAKLLDVALSPESSWRGGGDR